MRLAHGVRLGPYEIVSALGAGGMGEVYKATDTRLSRAVAIKILPGGDPDLIARFDREAKSVAALTHPNICALYDVGSAADPDPSSAAGSVIRYIVMEHLEGETLAQRVARGALPMHEAVAVAIGIGEALAAAHRAGIVHRDLKPANVMLTRAGPKLLDFGLAKAREATAQAGAAGVTLATREAALTGHGSILGTLHYMAPEQVEGQPADHRADIWALGCIVHEMTTGGRPFDAATPASVVAAILTSKPVPIDGDRPRSPLGRIVDACLARNPEERWQDARDLVRELRWIAEGVIESGAAPGAARRRRAPWIVAGVFAGLSALLGAMVWLRPMPVAPAVRFTVPPPAGSNFYDFADPVRISPDGRRLIVTANDADGRSQLWLYTFDAAAPLLLAGTEGAQYPFWSPDGRSVAFFTQKALKRITLAGAYVQTICETAAGVSGSWSPSDVIVFSADFGHPELFRVSAAGGAPARLTTLDVSQQETMHIWPQFLSDGDRFIYLVRSGRPERTGIYVSSLSKPAPVRLLAVESNVVVEGGEFYFARQGTLWAQPFDAARLRFGGEPVKIAEGVWTFSAIAGAAFSVANRTLVYREATKHATELWWLDRNGRRVGAIGGPGEYVHVAISPDDRRVAFERLDDSSGNGVVWLHDIDRSATTRLSLDASWNWSPVWSPDSARVAFASAPDGKAGIYVKAADGAGAQQPLVITSLLSHPTDWTRDGRSLLLDGAAAGGNADVWMLPLSGDRKPFPLLQTAFSESEARVSPNGRWLAYTSNESGRSEVYLRSFPEGDTKRLVSAAGGRQASWRGDGRELFYRTDAGAMMAVPVNGDGSLAGTPQELFRARIQQSFVGRYDYAPTSDGQRFLVNTITNDATPMATVIMNGTLR